jgi:hypothetical protein
LRSSSVRIRCPRHSSTPSLSLAGRRIDAQHGGRYTVKVVCNLNVAKANELTVLQHSFLVRYYTFWVASSRGCSASVRPSSRWTGVTAALLQEPRAVGDRPPDP